MDIEALQATLRTFAAERDWQPFHTPKNLSTALMVETAELAEIFQWMTPEQSATAHTDAVVRERIADEVADVLLYLLQIADQTQVDLKHAVGRKLVKNAKKYPPLRSHLPTGTAAASTVETHVLVDWENVQPKESDLRALVPDVTDVWIFHGPSQKVDLDSYGCFGSRATPVKIARSGKNALDFHLSFYMGYIASRHPDARFVVVSNDKGYGPMLEHAEELGFSARQAAFGAPKPAAKKAAAKTAAIKKTTRTPMPKAVVKTPAKTPAKKATVRKATLKIAAKAPATKEAKKPAATRQAASKAPAGTSKVISPATGPATARKAAPAKKARGLENVLTNLAKIQNRPTRKTTLLGLIKSLLATTDDDPAIQKTLNDMMAAGKVAITDTGTVQYNL